MKSSDGKILGFLAILFLIGLAYLIDIWLHGCISPPLGGREVCGDSAKEEAYIAVALLAVTSLAFLIKRWIHRKDRSDF